MAKWPEREYAMKVAELTGLKWYGQDITYQKYTAQYLDNVIKNHEQNLLKLRSQKRFIQENYAMVSYLGGQAHYP